MLIGLKNGSILEFDVSKNEIEVIMNAHHDGEVWGLEVVPGTNKFITSADDNKILVYDL